MTAQGVMSSPANALKSMLSGFSVPDMTVKGTNGNSFEDFMATSKEGKVQEANVYKVQKELKETNETSGDVRERAKDFFSGESKVKEADTAAPVESIEDIEEAVEVVSTLMVQVQTVICNELGISEEELTAAMDELGMEPEDLLDRNGLQELFLHLNQTSEPTELLTNEELFDEFTDLVQAVEQTIQESGFEPEEVKVVLKEAELLKKEAEPTGVVDVPEAPEKLLQTEGAEDVQVEGSEENVDMQAVTPQSETQAETQTETNDAKDEQHTVSAREEGNDKVISSETDVNVRDVFIDTLTNYAVAGTGEEAVEAAAQLRDIANQIMEQIKIVIKPEQTNMELQLNPEHLGRVHLTITEKEGMMTAQFTTQSEVAKEAIESQMATLRESLQNQGVKVEAIEVTVSEFGFERDRDARQNENGESGKQKRRNLFGVEEVDEATPQMADFLNVTDSSVDYSA